MISVIIINYNGRIWLPGCFDSLEKQSYKEFEIIFVDNASDDDSVKFVKDNYLKTKIIVNQTNVGFAEGNNIGIKQANGEYIFLLNTDTKIDQNCLLFLKDFMDKNSKVGSVQPKLVLMDNIEKIDVCGSFWTDSSFLNHFGFRKNAKDNKYNIPMKFFSNKGAAMMIRRTAIENVGGLFDNDFWCYYEETDFCHRLWIYGYECWYYPKAVVLHGCGSTAKKFKNSFIQFHNFKNKLLSFLKNLEYKTLIRIIPIYLLLIFLLSIGWLLQGKFKNFLSIYKSIFWNLCQIKNTLRKRDVIQKSRIISDKKVFSVVKKNPLISYYFYLFFAPQSYKE